MTTVHLATGALIEFFTPGSNRRSASSVRIINLENLPVTVDIHGYDDAKTLTDETTAGSDGSPRVSLELGPRAARNLPSWILERGPDNATGKLGDGVGKWTLVVLATGDVRVMSLLYNNAGYVTNVSR